MTDEERTKRATEEKDYSTLVNLWTNGVRDYHSLVSAYLTANSVFVAGALVLFSRSGPENVSSTAWWLLALSVLGIVVTLQMAVALSRFSAQNAFFEWLLRNIEGSDTWTQMKVFSTLWELREKNNIIQASNPALRPFKPNFGLRWHRRWFFGRARMLPVVFSIIYFLVLMWSLSTLLPICT